jgi:hypothetical protein
MHEISTEGVRDTPWYHTQTTDSFLPQRYLHWHSYQLLKNHSGDQNNEKYKINANDAPKYLAYVQQKLI